MCQKTVPWALAKSSDPHYSVYIQKRHDEGYGFSQFDRLPQGPKSIIYQIMHPDPEKRWNTEELLKQPYMNNIEFCHMVTSVTPSERKPGGSGSGSATDSGSLPTSPIEAQKYELPDPPIVKLNAMNVVVRHSHPLPSPNP
jgi:serine/threonine protein kinase